MQYRHQRHNWNPGRRPLMALGRCLPRPASAANTYAICASLRTATPSHNLRRWQGNNSNPRNTLLMLATPLSMRSRERSRLLLIDCTTTYRGDVEPCGNTTGFSAIDAALASYALRCLSVKNNVLFMVLRTYPKYGYLKPQPLVEGSNAVPLN